MFGIIDQSRFQGVCSRLLQELVLGKTQLITSESALRNYFPGNKRPRVAVKVVFEKVENGKRVCADVLVTVNVRARAAPKKYYD